MNGEGVKFFSDIYSAFNWDTIQIGSWEKHIENISYTVNDTA